MRVSALVLGGILAFGVSAAASAAPTVSRAALPQVTSIVRVAGGCGWGLHRTRWGSCVPNRRAYYRPYPYGPGYYGDGHEPWNRPSPGDHVANRLNRQELRGAYRPY
ncbi:MAG TPA: hypothetical protein VHU15_11640 [Stellaceae bacterium]|jgi:hypothetical protein|nr:hypothetical protein [Stellaceae bacterium]